MAQRQRSLWAVLLVAGSLLPFHLSAKDDVEAKFAVTVSAELEQDRGEPGFLGTGSGKDGRGGQ